MEVGRGGTVVVVDVLVVDVAIGYFGGDLEVIEEVVEEVESWAVVGVLVPAM